MVRLILWSLFDYKRFWIKAKWFSSQREGFINLFAVYNFDEMFYIGLFAFTYKNAQNLNIKLLVPPSCTERQDFNHWWLPEITWSFCWLLSFLPGALSRWGQVLSPLYLDRMPVSRLMWHWHHFWYHLEIGLTLLQLLWSGLMILLDETHGAISGPNMQLWQKS